MYIENEKSVRMFINDNLAKAVIFLLFTMEASAVICCGEARTQDYR